MTAFSGDDLFQHADAMRRLARDLVADAALADDAVQQAYITALQRPPRQPEAVGGWLRAVVRTCSLDLLRAEGRRRRREQEIAAKATIGPDQTAERLELQEAISAAVRGLGEPYTTAIWLRYYEGLTPTEIAARQGDPVKTVKTRLGRALQLLRSKLDDRAGGRERWLAAILPLLQPQVVAGGALAAGGSGALTLLELVGGFLAAVLVLGVAVFWPRTEPAAPVDRVSAAASSGTGSDVGASTGPPSAPRRSTAVETPLQREAVLPAATGPCVQVRVVAASGAVVPGVVVLYTDPQQASAAAQGLDEAERRLLQWDSVGWLHRFGARAETDGLGIARWPWLAAEGRSTAWWCALQHGDAYGELWVAKTAPATEVHELRLQPDREFVVKILDSRQSPVSGVPVAATFVRRGDLDSTGRQDFGPTDDDGCVRARHVQVWCERIAPRGETLPATLRLDLPGLDVAREFDANALPTEPITLFLPPLGAFEVTVRDAFGEPAVGERIELREDGRHDASAHSATTDVAGIARFRWVGLDRSWRLDREHLPPDRMQIVVGPKVAGEVVRVLRQPEPAPVLLGRLLRDGAPVVNTSLAVATPGRDLTRSAVATDAEGRFRIAVAPAWRDRHLTELLVQPYSPAGGYDGTRAVWRGDLLLSVGPCDLGALALEPEPVVAAGRLVLPDGATLPEALRVGVEVATGELDEPWRWLSLRARRQPDGQFALFGTASNAALRLVVVTGNHFVPVPPMPFVAGARELRVELHRGGSVRATVLADTQLAAFCQVPLLVPMDAASVLAGRSPFDPGLDPRMARDSSFVGDAPLEMAHVWPAVAPGRYRLEIWARGLHRPLHAVPGVVVVDGQRNEDPRLQKLAVPGLRTITLTLPQAGEAQRLPQSLGVGVIAVLDGDLPGSLCWQVDDQTAHFATVQPLDVLVRLHGFRDRIVRGLVGNQTIEMQPGISVTLRTEGYAVPAGHTLRLGLAALDDVIARDKPQIYSAAAGGAIPGYRRMVMAGESAAGAISLRLPARGRHRVTAELRAADGTTSPLAVAPAELVIGDEGGTFALQLTPAR